MLLPFYGVFHLCATTRKELLNRDIFALAIYILIISLAQALIMLYAMVGRNNLMFFNIFIPIEFAFFIFILALNYKAAEKMELALAFFIIAGCWIIIGTTKSINSFPSLLILIESVVVIPLAFNAEIKSIRNNQPQYLYRDMLYKGLLIYCLGNFIVAGFIKEHLHAVVTIHTILNSYANYSFMKSFIIYRREMNGL